MSAAVSVPAADALALAVTGLEPESAMALRSCFEEMFSQAEKWTASARLIVVTSADQKREMKMARESRLALREIRVKAEHARKRLKEDSTRRGKAIDGIANVLKALIEPIEEHLLEQETFADRIESSRKSALKSAREETLRALGADPSAFANLGETSEETWALTLDAAKDAKTARDEAAKQAELVRVEAERIAAEKRETARLERIKVEAERVERERLVVEESARLRAALAERDRVAHERAEERAASDRARAAAEQETGRAREEADRAARELAAVKAEAATAERDREAAAIGARQAAALAPDREKLAAFAAVLRALEIPALTTDPGKAAAAKVADQIEKMATWVAKTGASL